MQRARRGRGGRRRLARPRRRRHPRRPERGRALGAGDRPPRRGRRRLARRAAPSRSTRAEAYRGDHIARRRPRRDRPRSAASRRTHIQCARDARRRRCRRVDEARVCSRALEQVHPRCATTWSERLRTLPDCPRSQRSVPSSIDARPRSTSPTTRRPATLLAEDPFALLVGFAIDQQVPVQKAFAGPYVLKRARRHARPEEAREARPDRDVHREAGDPPLPRRDGDARARARRGRRRRLRRRRLTHLERGRRHRRPEEAHRLAARASAR